jgi:hypothetical protein
VRHGRAVLAAAAVAALLVAGCGDDDGGTDATAEDAEATSTTSTTAGADGDAQAYCEAVAPAQDLDVTEAPTQEQVDSLREAGDAAPTDDLAEAMTTFADFAQRLVDVDLSDPEQVAPLEGLGQDPELVQAAADLNAFTSEECGFAVSVFAGVAGEPVPGEGGDDAEDVDTDAVRDELASSAPDVEENLLGITDLNGTYIATIVGIGDGDAQDACNELSDAFVAAGFEGATIQVADEEGTVYAEGESGTGCVTG